MIIALTLTAKTALSSAFVLLPVPVAVLAFVAAHALSSPWRSALYLQGAASVLQAASYAAFLVHKGAIPVCVASALVAWISGAVFYAKVVFDATNHSSILSSQKGVQTAHFVLWTVVAALAGAYSLYVMVSKHSSIVSSIESGTTPSTISVGQFQKDPLGVNSDTLEGMNTASTVSGHFQAGQRNRHSTVDPTTNHGHTSSAGTTRHHVDGYAGHVQAPSEPNDIRVTPLLPSMEHTREEITAPRAEATPSTDVLAGLQAIPSLSVPPLMKEPHISPEPTHTPHTSSFGSINFSGLNIRSPASSKFIHPSLQIHHNGRRMDRLRHSIDELSDGHYARHSAEIATGSQSVFSAASASTEHTVKTPQVDRASSPAHSPSKSSITERAQTPPRPGSPVKSSHGSIYTSANNSLNSSPSKSPKKPSRLSRLSRLSLSLEGLNDIAPMKLRKSRSDFVLPETLTKKPADGTTTPADEFNQWEIQDVAWNLRNVSGSSADSAGTRQTGQRSVSTASSGVNMISSRGFVREEVV